MKHRVNRRLTTRSPGRAAHSPFLAPARPAARSSPRRWRRATSKRRSPRPARAGETRRRRWRAVRRERSAHRAGARHRRPGRAAAARAGGRSRSPTSPTGRSSGRSPRRSPSGRRTRAPRGFAIIALGKLGSRELNYSSDVDLLFLYDPGDPAAEAARGAGPGGAADRPARRSRCSRSATGTAMSSASTCGCGRRPK